MQEQDIIRALAALAQSHRLRVFRLLVVAGQDFGKALGMLLRPQLQQLPLAVIDEVIVRAGDYIDIGTPLFGGSVVPVTVKSLAFPS